MSINICRKREAGQSTLHETTVYALSSREGLPTAILKKEALVVDKQHRSVTIIKTSAGIVGAGVGALCGVLVTGCFLVYSEKYFSHVSDGNHARAFIGAVIVGKGVGAITGYKIATSVTNRIFGR